MQADDGDRRESGIAGREIATWRRTAPPTPSDDGLQRIRRFGSDALTKPVGRTPSLRCAFDENIRRNRVITRTSSRTEAPLPPSEQPPRWTKI